MNVSYLPVGNIVDDDADILVNTVNCVGVMGKGVARAFATAFPWIVPHYQAQCRYGLITPGSCSLYPLQDERGRLWAALATKNHWYYPSKLEWISSGLSSLAIRARLTGAKSIAIPPPGCGHGGLDWHVVEPMVLDALEPFDLRIYAASTLKHR